MTGNEVFLTTVRGITEDLTAEHEALDALVRDLDEVHWSLATPADGWSIRDQISHLTYFDVAARLAIVDHDRFQAHTAELMAAHIRDRDAVGDTALGRSVDGPKLLAQWRAARRELVKAAVEARPDERIPWYARPMSLATFLTARLMETWAHGQDVADALGHPPLATERLRHVCEIAVRARPYAFQVNGRTDPGDEIWIELTSPAGRVWTWGPDKADNRICGPALHFALIATQRRHIADTSLRLQGTTARQWMEIAQTFAGPPGAGRRPGHIVSGPTGHVRCGEQR